MEIDTGKAEVEEGGLSPERPDQTEGLVEPGMEHDTTQKLR